MAELEFGKLLAAHVATSSAEATLVLAAATAFCGLQADGTPMQGACAQPPTLRELAGELGLHVGAVRRGVQDLVAAGVAKITRDGVSIEPVALAARWAARSCVVRLSADVRSLGLRCEPLLVAGVVAGEANGQGHLVAGYARWCARTGLLRRTIMRAIAKAAAAGAIRKWTLPNTAPDRRGPLCCALPEHRDLAPMRPDEPASRAASRSGTNDPDGSASRAASRSGTGNPRTQTGCTNPGLGAAPQGRALLEPEAGTEGTEGTKRTAGTEGNPRDPHHDLRRLLLSTRIREGVGELDPMARWEFVDRLAAALHGAGMSCDDAQELYAIAEHRTNKPDGDPTGLFFHLCGGPWRRLLDDRRARRREAAARRRGRPIDSQTARRPLERPPQDLGDVLAGLLRQVRHG